MRVLYIKYSLWKQVAQNNSLAVYDKQVIENTYKAWAGDRDLVYHTDVRPTDASDYTTTFPTRTTVEDEDEAIALIVNLKALLTPVDTKGRAYSVPWVTEGSRTTKISHRWNDPTTWIGQATQKTNQSCSANTAGQEYAMPDQNIIDVYHGKLWEEEDLDPSHRVSVEIDTGGGWTAVTEKDPHSGVGDYTVDYAAGTITFNPTIDAGASVRASYYCAGGSQYILAPDAGKRLLIKSAEVQFSSDVEQADTVIFETFGYVDVFAPQLMPGIPSGTKIPIKKTVYKTLHQFIDESNGSYPQIPAIGGSSWRGVQHPITVFPWNYAAALPLSSAAGMEVRIYCEHDIPFAGSYATATFYCLSEDE